VSWFRVLKYSSLLFLAKKYRTKLFRVIAVLLFALLTSLLYQDVADFLEARNPEHVIYALIGKIIIVYGALVFVLWQFRPEPELPEEKTTVPASGPKLSKQPPPKPMDRLDGLADIDSKPKLKSRYEKLIDREPR
jgi:hypothetical protein